MAEFIDISNNTRTPIDWRAVANQGIAGVYCKVTEGSSFIDQTYPTFDRAARAVGLPVGGYHYLHHGNIQAQANLFLRELGGHELKAVMDVEVHGCTPDDALQFGDAIGNKLGYAPILYTYASFLQNDLRDDRRLQQFPLWIAAYASRAPVTPWPWAAWQHTDKAIVNGVPNPVDCSTTPDLNALHIPTFDPPAPVPPEAFMAAAFLAKPKGSQTVYSCTGGSAKPIDGTKRPDGTSDLDTWESILKGLEPHNPLAANIWPVEQSFIDALK